MTRLLNCCAIVALCLIPIASAGQIRPALDGAILELAPYEYPAYGVLPDWMKRSHTPAAYEAYTHSGPTVSRIKYRSGGLDVIGFIARAAREATVPQPVIVLNRGGVGEGAKIGAATFHVIDEMRDLAAEGFVVVASQYRGVDGIGGQDEVGGADVTDVMNLLPVIRALEHVDSARLFMVGFSRGGQMALQAIRRGFPARAVAVIGAPTDWEEAQRVSPRLAQIARDSWPDFATRHLEHARERSAVAWAGEIAVPVLIIQGGADASVPVSQSLSLARRMTEAGRTYELIVYAGDDHGVNRNGAERLRRTVAWFRAHDTTNRAAEKVEPPVVVRARDFAFEMPATFAGGLVTLRFDNVGQEPHYLRFMRLGDGKTAADVTSWRQSRTPSPSWLTPSGGIGTVAPGRSAQNTFHLDPGRYVVLCGHPSPDGTPHVDKGMLREIEVTAAGRGVAPTATRTLDLTDHAFSFTPPIARGIETWRISNRDTSVHQALLVKLPVGVSADAELGWFRGGSRGSRPGEPIGGVIELAPGQDAWLTVALEPGEYVLLCGVGSQTERHFDRGMVQRFTVA